MAQDYNPAMDLYGKISEISPAYKQKADEFLAGLTKKYNEKYPAPPEEVKEGLEKILEESKRNQKNNQGASIGLYPKPLAVAGIIALIAYLL
jgi:hypothetical protein